MEPNKRDSREQPEATGATQTEQAGHRDGGVGRREGPGPPNAPGTGSSPTRTRSTSGSIGPDTPAEETGPADIATDPNENETAAG